MSLDAISRLWMLALAAFLIGRLAEWLIHRRNYQAMQAMGAQEMAPWRMRGYYFATVSVVPIALLEQYLDPGMPSRALILCGATLAGIAVIFRMWAIRSLGPLWTMRCLALPGIRTRTIGPYRLFGNPEYISRLIEGSGICLLLGAEISLVIYVVLTAAYGVYLSGMERQHMETVAAAHKMAREEKP